MSATPSPPGRKSARRASITEAQRRQVLIDTERRAFGGIFVHLPCWLLVVAASGIHRDHPGLVVSIAVLHLVLAVARAILHPRFAALAERRYPVARALFLTLLLAGSLLWGIVGAAALRWPPLMPTHETIRLVGLAICAAGTMTLAIMPTVRILMPLLLTGPYIITLLLKPDATTIVLALMAVVFWGYVVAVSRAVGRDYWDALNAHLLLEQRAEELERLSVTDALTQVYNRLHFDRRISEEWTRAQRSADALSVLMVDLDHFKKINDVHGHPFGDTCLKESAAALGRVLFRPGDLLARYGGEEFVVLLPNTDAVAAMLVAERMREAVSALELAGANGVVRVTCSIGVGTMLPSPRSSWMTLLAQADAALYRAKEQGRNRAVAHVAVVVSAVGSMAG